MIGPQLPEGWGQQARDEAREEAEPFARAQVSRSAADAAARRSACPPKPGSKQ